MKWQLYISSACHRSDAEKTYSFEAPNLESAKKKSLEYFDRFSFDTGQDYYDHEDDLPSLSLCEQPTYIEVDIVEYWKEGEIESKKAAKAAAERRDRDTYEALKKKFEK
jgi:hypothetical protein